MHGVCKQEFALWGRVARQQKGTVKWIWPRGNLLAECKLIFSLARKLLKCFSLGIVTTLVTVTQKVRGQFQGDQASCPYGFFFQLFPTSSVLPVQLRSEQL